MSYNKFFAVDLGATSGRTILGTIDNGKLQLEEITRFPNAIIQVNGHFFWNIYALYEEILKGLKGNYITTNYLRRLRVDVFLGLKVEMVGL